MRFTRDLFAAAMLIVGILSSGLALATAQEPDRLIVGGKSFALTTNPLRVLLRSAEISIPAPDETWTSNWRGYVATWEIRDEQLLLTALEVLLRPAGEDESVSAEPVDVLSDVFDLGAEVAANWYSGTLVVPHGKLVRYVHMGYGSVYEGYKIFEIEGGKVIAQADLDSAEYEALREDRFENYKTTSEYRERRAALGKEFTDQRAERFLFEVAVEEYLSVRP